MSNTRTKTQSEVIIKEEKQNPLKGITLPRFEFKWIDSQKKERTSVFYFSPFYEEIFKECPLLLDGQSPRFAVLAHTLADKITSYAASPFTGLEEQDLYYISQPLGRGKGCLLINGVFFCSIPSNLNLQAGQLPASGGETFITLRFQGALKKYAEVKDITNFSMDQLPEKERDIVQLITNAVLKDNEHEKASKLLTNKIAQLKEFSALSSYSKENPLGSINRLLTTYEIKNTKVDRAKEILPEIEKINDFLRSYTTLATNHYQQFLDKKFKDTFDTLYKHYRESDNKQFSLQETKSIEESCDSLINMRNQMAETTFPYLRKIQSPLAIKLLMNIQDIRALDKKCHVDKNKVMVSLDQSRWQNYCKKSEKTKRNELVVDKSNMALYQIQGDRDYQEDRVIDFILKGFCSLSKEQREVVIRKAFVDLNQEFINMEDVGSTATLVFAWIDRNNVLHVVTATLGDSPAYIAVNNKNQETKEIDAKLSKQLNDGLMHKLYLDNVEFKRYAEFSYDHDQYIKEGRLHGLDLSGSLGDIQYEEVGLTHVPCIREEEYPLSKEQTIRIGIFSDGVINLDNPSLLKILKDSSSAASAVKEIITLAYQNGSRDNISGMVFEPTRLTDESSDIAVGAIFDGHGGDFVAELAKHKLPGLLQKAMNCVLQKKSETEEKNTGQNEVDIMATIKSAIYHNQSIEEIEKHSSKELYSKVKEFLLLLEVEVQKANLAGAKMVFPDLPLLKHLKSTLEVDVTVKDNSLDSSKDKSTSSQTTSLANQLMFFSSSHPSSSSPTFNATQDEWFKITF